MVNYKMLGYLALAGVIGFVAIGALATVFTQGSIEGPNMNPDTDQPATNDSEQMAFDGPWAQQNLRPKLKVEIEDLQSNAVSDGTIYFYDEKPTTDNGDVVWCGTGNGEVSDYFGDKKDKVSFSSGEATLQYTPQEYFLYVNSTGKYDECTSITIPDGSDIDRKFDDYQTNPSYADEPVVMADKHSPSLAAFDLAVTNTTGTETWDDDQTIRPAEYTQYHADYAMVYVGDVDATTDSNDNGDYDEGIKKFELEASGAGTASKTIFYSTEGIDELGDNNKARVDLNGITATHDQGLTLTPIATTFATKDSGHTAAQDDEICTAGENPFDIKLFDDAGDTTSKIDVNC